MITIPGHDGGRTHDPLGGATGGGAESGPRQVHFVSDFRYLERPYAALAPLLLEVSPAWLRVLSSRSARLVPTDPAAGGGFLPSAVVRVGLGRRRPKMSVLVTLGSPRARPGEVVVPLVWEPVQLEQLLPSLDSDLSLTDVDGTACRLGLTGRYQVPLSAIGERLDRFALHGVAESSVRTFLEDVETALTAGGASEAM